MLLLALLALPLVLRVVDLLQVVKSVPLGTIFNLQHAPHVYRLVKLVLRLINARAVTTVTTLINTLVSPVPLPANIVLGVERINVLLVLHNTI